jgi:hypothetical protein
MMAQGGYIDLPPFHVHHNIRVQTTAIGSHAAWSCISSASQGVLIQALSDHETTVPGMAMVINTATQWLCGIYITWRMILSNLLYTP